MKPRSIRFRLTVWYSLVLLLGLGLFGGFVWLAMRSELNSRTDAALAARARGVESTLRSLPAEDAASFTEEITELAHSLPSDYLLEVTGPNVTIYTTPQARALFAKRVEKADYRSLEHRAMLWGHLYLIRIAESTGQTTEVLTQLGLLLLAAIPGMVLPAAAGGYWLSRRALTAVDDMTSAARSIGIANLSARLPVPETRDEIQRLAATWNEVLARLESAVSRINQFTADASHELRTPIAFIRSTAEIAQRRPRTDAEYRDALKQIEMESERMTELVDGLLFLARAEGQKAGLELKPLDLRQPVKEACAEVSPIAFSKQIAFELVADDTPLPVLGNPSSLRRMSLALLDNAVKYTPAGGSVSVSLRRVNGTALLTVLDTGAGIPGDALPHIFERFFRADPSRSRESGGYGLGLSIVRTIAQQHNGSVNAMSQPAQGSQFEVTLPIYR